MEIPESIGKIRPLATTQLMMTWLSMCPADHSASSRQKKFYIANTLTAFIANLIHCTASLVFCVKNISFDFGGAIFAVMATSGTLGLMYSLIAATRMRQQIGDIFKDLSTIYRANEKAEEFRYLVKANDTSEWMWSIYFKYIAFTGVSFVSNILFSVWYCYKSEGYFNYDHVFRPVRIFLPWDQTTIIGYFAEVCVTTVTSYGYLILTGTPMLVFMSLCVHHQAFYEMFKHSIDNSAQHDDKLLRHLIRFHISVKDWFLNSANVYRSFVLVQLFGGAVVMTISTFLLELQAQHIDYTLASVLSTASIGIACLFFYCYFGELATRSYDMMTDCIYNMDWYEQPSEQQKYFVLMIQNMQIPLTYHGFKVADLDLRTFIVLCRKVLSYYLAIKTIAAK